MLPGGVCLTSDPARLETLPTARPSVLAPERWPCQRERCRPQRPVVAPLARLSAEMIRPTQSILEAPAGADRGEPVTGGEAPTMPSHVLRRA